MDGGKQKHPIFNGEWEILSSLGEGNTSKVYLAKNLSDGKEVALKLLREEFLQRDPESIKSVEQEIQILQGLKHGNIVNIVGYGSDGTVLKPSGRKIENLVYILLEYVTGGLLFDLCQSMGGMGEEYGRFFLNQIIEVVGYMQGKGVVHRDLKLENILVDNSMNLKVADFGFATYKKINKLQSYRGTMTYMAPEIKEGKTYDGKQIDVFSCGVILFIIVQGIFPFKEAKKDEYFYNLIMNGKLDQYWAKVGGNSLSEEFKDLILKMFAYDGAKRPTVEELRNHPWMAKSYDIKAARSDLIEKLSTMRSEKTADSSTGKADMRGTDDDLQLVRQAKTGLDSGYTFNDMNHYDTIATPGYVKELINSYNNDYAQGVLKIEQNDEKQFLTIIRENKEEPANTLIVKIKFFDISAQEDEGAGDDKRYRIEFKKKRGNLMDWYELLADMKELTLNVPDTDQQVLLTTRPQQQEIAV